MSICTKKKYPNRKLARIGVKKESNRYGVKFRAYKCSLCDNARTTRHLTSHLAVRDKIFFRRNIPTISNLPVVVSVANFNGEYTGVFIDTGKGLDLRKCNSVCGDCGLKISHFTKRNIEGEYTFIKGKCNCCKKESHITNINHYN